MNKWENGNVNNWLASFSWFYFHNCVGKHEIDANCKDEISMLHIYLKSGADAFVISSLSFSILKLIIFVLQWWPNYIGVETLEVFSRNVAITSLLELYFVFIVVVLDSNIYIFALTDSCHHQWFCSHRRSWQIPAGWVISADAVMQISLCISMLISDTVGRVMWSVWKVQTCEYFGDLICKFTNVWKVSNIE